MNDQLKLQLKNIPTQPGCYIYYNKNKEIIYVGKAKNLYNRVNSYFTRFQSVKTDELVKNIETLDYIVTNSNKESLLLEINLIQKNKPKYNILLKDGRNYPFIRITNEQHPKIDYVLNRKDDKNQGTYYGPFPDSSTAKKLVDIINKIFKFRKCKTIPKKKCIYYDINLCHGPCIKNIDSKIYEEELKMIENFFNSKPSFLINYLKNQMYTYSEKMDFEKALEIRDALKYINEFIEKQIIDIDDYSDFEIISILEKDGVGCMYTLSLRGGLILAHDVKLKDQHDFEEILINRYYQDNIKIYVDNLAIYKNLEGVIKNIKIPQKGIYLDLLQMARKNAQIQLDKELLVNTKQSIINQFFINQLKIKKPQNIFMLDISHLGGEFNVGGLVCFSNDIKNKKLYRHYKISFDRNDDVNSIKEVIKRIIENKNVLNNIDLLIIDGGVNQKNAVERLFKENNININVLSLEKDNKHTTANILYKNQEIELKTPTLLSYFSRIQDEAHRFANTYMNNLNKKSKTNSIYSQIPGIGPKRIKIIESNFTNFFDLYNASIDDLTKLGIPEASAIMLLEKLMDINDK